LLVDIHGEGQEPDTIHRGTQNGRTVSRLLGRQGSEALAGPARIFGWLEDAGYDVVPPTTAPPTAREDPRYVGGYTVQTYGSHQPNGIDAIQIEIGSTFRREDTMDDFAGDLAKAIAELSWLFHVLSS